MLIPLTDIVPIDPKIAGIHNDWLQSKWKESNGGTIRSYFVPSDFSREDWIVSLFPPRTDVDFVTVEIRHFCVLITGIQITGNSNHLTNVSPSN